MTHDTLEFFKAQWDKILLFMLVLHFTGCLLFLMWRYPNLNAATLQWIEKSIDLAEGALIGAVTTAAAMRRIEPPPAAAPKPEEKK